MNALWFAVGACAMLIAESWIEKDAEVIRHLTRYAAPVILAALVIALVAWRAA